MKTQKEISEPLEPIDMTLSETEKITNESVSKIIDIFKEVIKEFIVEEVEFDYEEYTSCGRLSEEKLRLDRLYAKNEYFIYHEQFTVKVWAEKKRKMKVIIYDKGKMNDFFTSIKNIPMVLGFKFKLQNLNPMKKTKLIQWLIKNGSIISTILTSISIIILAIKK